MIDPHVDPAVAVIGAPCAEFVLIDRRDCPMLDLNRIVWCLVEIIENATTEKAVFSVHTH